MKSFSLLIFFLSACAILTAQVIPGAHITEGYFHLLKGKKLAVVANQTSLIHSTHLVDSLLAADFNVVRVFAPEHGFRGDHEAGVLVSSETDKKTGLPVISLYAKNKKPLPSQMQGLDLVIFDIQDVGVRFYTYISTLHYVMEACAENGIPLIVLDRPNPNGHYVDGPVLDTAYRSFVGMHPVPVVYGMTIGEYARMINGEKWLKNGVTSNLTVIPCQNYTHETSYVLPVKPSPNLPNTRSVELYPTLCFFEGTPLSIGRGTAYPFQVVGHPLLKDKMPDTFSFTPELSAGSPSPLQAGKICYGYNFSLPASPQPGEWIDTIRGIKVELLLDLYQRFSDKNLFFNKDIFFDKLAGNSDFRKDIASGKSASEIKQRWEPGLEEFREIRQKYLLYE
jgi:uncharacterized protein YbbC (DUF1343 family)